jgi:hypothetical protein
MSTATKQTHFNSAQLDVIKTLSFVKSKRVAIELKKVIVSHFVALIDDEMEKLWESGKISNMRNNKIAKTHLRTPYKK